MNPVGEANVEYFAGSRTHCRCQNKTMDSGYFPTFAMVTVPVPAQQPILHSDATPSDRKLQMEVNKV